MAFNFSEFPSFGQNLAPVFGKEHLEVVTSAATQLAKNLQAIAAETTDFSKKSLETSSAFMEKLMGAKSLETAIQIQSEYAKTSYANFVAEATKMSELYTNLARDAFKPVETTITKFQPPRV